VAADSPAEEAASVDTLAGSRLVLLRHGQTAWNASGRAQGHADVGLDEVGHAQAAAAAAYLATLRPVALWSSDLARARTTAGYVERVTGLSAKPEARLREFDVGARQGLSMPAFAERFPRAYDAWRRGEETPHVPGAEVTAEVAMRIVPALREALAALGEGDTGIVVAHGAALKVGLAGLLGWPTELTATLRAMDNCAWATVERREPGGRLRLVGYNERCRAPAG
jgi:probable phosphoglycerate mutase